jgi:hypothetical protein
MSAKTSGKRVRDCSLHVYFKEQEHEVVRQAAAQAGQSTSSWVRAIALQAARRERRRAVALAPAGPRFAGAEDE